MFKVVFIDANLARSTALFASEKALVKKLTATYYTKAPIGLSYADGTVLERKTLDRIHHRLFQARRR